MNSKSRAIDNIVNVKELKEDIKNFIDSYNYRRFHSSFNYDKPMNVYRKMLHKVAWKLISFNYYLDKWGIIKLSFTVCLKSNFSKSIISSSLFYLG